MLPENPLVSVIVPVFNREKFVAEAIGSVFAQDYRPIEVIVVDDGSTDRSVEMALAFDGLRLVRQENRGAAAARNSGIEVAKGELVTFLDSDDVLLPTKISAQVSYLSAHPEVACVLCHQEVFREPGTSLPDLPGPGGLAEAPVPLGLAHLWREIRAGGMTALIRSEALEQVGGFDVSFTCAEDLDWHYRVWRSGVGLDVLPENLVRKRVHDLNLSRDAKAVREGWVRFLRNVRRASGDDGSQIATGGSDLPLVSVIVPVFNGESFLPDALRSVLAQDYRPIEVIVVDDGSTDRSREIAATFERVRVISQDNRGAAAARNAGIAIAKGELMTFLDADDEMLPGKLAAQVGYLRAHPEVGCVLCRHEFVVEKGVGRPPWMQPDRLIGDPGGVMPLSCIVRRGAVEKGGTFDDTFRMGEGIEWLGRLRASGVAIELLPRVLLRRRVHKANLTHDQRSMGREILRGLKGRIDRGRSDADPGPTR